MSVLLLTAFTGLAAQPSDTPALDVQAKLSLQEGLAVQANVLAGQSSVYGGWLYTPEPEQEAAVWSAWLSLRYPWLMLGALAKNGNAMQLLQPFGAEMRPFAGDDQPFKPATASTAEYSGLAVGRNVGLFRINRFRMLEQGGSQIPELLLNGLSGLWLDFGRMADGIPVGHSRAFSLPDRISIIAALQPNTVRPEPDWFAVKTWPGWRLWYSFSLLQTDQNSELILSLGQQLGLPGASALYWRTQYQFGLPALRLKADWAVSSGAYYLPALYSASAGADGGYTFSGAPQGSLLPLYHLQLSGQWKILPWLNLRLLFRTEQASAEQAALGSLHFYPDISTPALVLNISGIFTCPTSGLRAIWSGNTSQLDDWEAVLKAKLSSPILPGLVLAGTGRWQEAGTNRLDMELAWSGVFVLPAGGQPRSGIVSPGKSSFNPACFLLLRQEADAVYIKPRLELALLLPAANFVLQAGFSEYWQLVQLLPAGAASSGVAQASQPVWLETSANKPVPELSLKYQLSL